MLHGYRQLYSLQKNREYLYWDIAKNVETTFDTSNYELEGPLSKGKNKKEISLMKDESGRKIKRSLQWGQKHSYLTKNSEEDEKQKAQKCNEKKT